jgi:hypothetical protein
VLKPPCKNARAELSARAGLTRWGWRSPQKGAKSPLARHVSGVKEDAAEAADAAAGPGVSTYQDGNVLSTVRASKLPSRMCAQLCLE